MCVTEVIRRFHIYNIFSSKIKRRWKHTIVSCFEVSQINWFILYCLTRDDDTTAVLSIQLNKMLIKDLHLEAEKLFRLNTNHIKNITSSHITALSYCCFGVQLTITASFVVPQVTKNRQKTWYLFTSQTLFII